MEKVFKKIWTPLTEEVSDNYAKINVWNRDYIFDNSLFPTEIISKNIQMLYAPIKLTPVFSEQTGEWVDICNTKVLSDDEKSVFVASATCNNVIANTTVTTEFDGFVKIDLRLMSYWQFAGNGQNTPTLTGLYLDIPVKKECATLFHYWPNDKTSIIPAADVMNSGKTENSKFPFKPYISLGNNEIGLGVFCGESCKNYNLSNEDECIEVLDKGEYVNIRINILDKMPENWQGKNDRWVDTLKPVTYTFGFMATPVKPIRCGDETYKIHQIFDCEDMKKNGEINYELLDTLQKHGVKTLILHENWTAIQNFGLPQDKEFCINFIKEAHKRKIKILVYFGYEYSTLTPDFNKKCEDYLIKTVDNQFTGGWQRKPHQRAFMVCYNGGYSDVKLERVIYAMDVLGADGIYTDGTYVPWECANTAHGCGYTDDNGKLHTTFPVLAVREHVKKLYKAVHERGGIIDTHQSSCCIMPTLSFCDSYYDGENIQGQLTKENMDFLSLDAFRAEYMGHNLGISANFIAYTNKERPMSALCALTLLHNVFPRPREIDALEYISTFWKIFDDYKLNDSEWVPYWNNTDVLVKNEKAYASLYNTKDSKVLVVSNFNNNENLINLITSTDYKKAVSLLNNKEYEISNKNLAIECEPATVDILLLKN